MEATRRSALGVGASLATLAIIEGSQSMASAQDGKRTITVPAAVRWKVGEIDVIAVHDGYVRLPMSVMPAAEKVEEERLRQAAFMAGGNVPVSINAFVIRGGGKLALVDTGAGNKLGPTAGKLIENLRAIGIDAGDISTLLMTHLHSDHSFGLTDAAGKPAFPNAEFVVNSNEAEYWLDDANLAKVPEFQKRYFTIGRDALKPYASRTRKFSRDGEEVFPGVTAVALYGHTAGHTGYRISSGKDQLLIWGDIVHMPHLQFARPEWGITFDTDGEAAIATRKRTLDMAAADRIIVAGMHTGFPGFGQVVREKQGYSLIPATWQAVD